jgi:hypothetical protein
MGSCSPCNGSGTGGAAGTGQSVNAAFDISIGGTPLPEPGGIIDAVYSGAEAATLGTLVKGSYKLTGRIANAARVPVLITNKTITVPADSGRQLKRVYIHKLSIERAQVIDGAPGSGFEAIVTVLDNPLPVAAIVYGLSAVATLTAGWFFVDKVDRFTNTTSGSIITIAAAVAGLWLIFSK